MTNHRLIDISLDQQAGVRWTPEIEQERRIAIYDLLEENHFALRRQIVDKGQIEDKGDEYIDGPYYLNLKMIENRLVFEISNQRQEQLDHFILPLIPFRRMIREYSIVCESYFEAIRTASPTQIEAIDVGRRTLHNEGSTRLQDRLSPRIEIDFNTARRLFTLIALLHLRH